MLPAGSAAQAPALTTVLGAYSRAIADSATPVERLTIVGTVAGSGLTGSFAIFRDHDRERSEHSLGPRAENTLRIGDRVWYADENRDVREYTGLLLRRARTQRFIESGDFAQAPDRCAYRGRTSVEGRPAYAVDVAAIDGETETVYLDARTFLPDRVAYDDDDGRTTIDFFEWRDVAGRRYPYRTVMSDGDRAFDTTELTTSIDPDAPIDPARFAPLISRRIEMTAPETIGLISREGHLYAPVRIAGKPYLFLLDSGAQSVVIDARVASAAGLSPVGALEASGAARTGGLRLATLPVLEVGTNARMSDLVVSTLDLGAATEGALRIDGILGYPFFASSTVRVDPAQRSMTFGPPGSLAPLGERLALETDRGVPEANLRLNASVDGRFLIDTGNAGEVLLYKRFVDKHGGIVPFSSTGRHSFGIGGSAASYRSSLDELSIGDTALYNAETDVMLATHGAFADRFDAGNVGLGVLRNFVVTFDESSDALYLVRGSAFDDGRTRN